MRKNGKIYIRTKWSQITQVIIEQYTQCLRISNAKQSKVLLF